MGYGGAVASPSSRHAAPWRVTWLVVATAIGITSLVVITDAKDQGEPFINGRSIGLYACVLLAIALLAYALHRVAALRDPQSARRQAARDTLLSGVFAAPAVLVVFVLVGAVTECWSGCP